MLTTMFMLLCVQLVLSTAKAKASTLDILATHCIAHDRSPELRKADSGAAAAGQQQPAGGSKRQRQQQQLEEGDDEVEVGGSAGQRGGKGRRGAGR